MKDFKWVTDTMLLLLKLQSLLSSKCSVKGEL